MTFNFNKFRLSLMFLLLYLCFACQTKHELRKADSIQIDSASEYFAKKGIDSDIDFSLALENLNYLDAQQKEQVDSRLNQYLNSGEFNPIVYNSFLLQSLEKPKSSIEKYFKLFISKNEDNKYSYFLYALHLLNNNNNLAGKKILELSKQAEKFDNFERSHRELYFKENAELSANNLVRYIYLSGVTNTFTDFFNSVVSLNEKGVLTKADLEYICSQFEHHSDMLIIKLAATNLRIRIKASSDENLLFNRKLYKKMIKIFDQEINTQLSNGSKKLDLVKSFFLSGQIMSTLDLIK